MIGVHEDGDHLLLADGDGGRYRLALDDALRAAARRDRPRLGQLQIEIEAVARDMRSIAAGLRGRAGRRGPAAQEPVAQLNIGVAFARLEPQTVGRAAQVLGINARELPASTANQAAVAQIV